MQHAQGDRQALVLLIGMAELCLGSLGCSFCRRSSLLSAALCLRSSLSLAGQLLLQGFEL